MNLTDHQLMILSVVRRGNLDGSNVDLDQLLERLWYEEGWKTTKESIQFSIRALQKRGILEKGPREIRRGRSRATFFLTVLGKQITLGSG